MITSPALGYVIISLCIVTILCTVLFIFYTGYQVSRIDQFIKRIDTIKFHFDKIQDHERELSQLENMYDTTRKEIIKIREHLGIQRDSGQLNG